MSPLPVNSQRSVRVENISPRSSVINTREHVIVSMLQRWFEVTLDSEASATKALSLSGHVLQGMPIQVGLLFDPDLLVNVSQKSQSDIAADETRRNLYVLGLPHDFSLDEFKALFRPYGTIEHAVILAVLDNFSRRRGFVVFATHAQARAAMRATHKIGVKGHQLNVSWAVVQRSSGFLDGADRVGEALGDNSASARKPSKETIAPTNDGPAKRPSNPIASSNTTAHDSKHALSTDFINDNLGTTFASTLLVSNLCPWLFQTHIDIHALFAPYGFVKRITFIPPLQTVPSPKESPKAVIVEYADLQSALSALYQLSNTAFGTSIVRASLFKDAMQRAIALQVSEPTATLTSNHHISAAPLYDQAKRTHETEHTQKSRVDVQ
ncbi:hypothetical protein PIIN_06521 [Serendipita indica DSM 11827]|uniref:RRM domain-containing protein n=1 Tax=Serendipita indica (strain DSM 11827) TaxID=1109443 RepID=G4TMP1_SERID|nr:hypothetical protein PIIN_06521 [Serendipita indica DSM 11827]